MGFFKNLVKGSIGLALTPVAVVKDAVDVVTGDTSPSTTADLLDNSINTLLDE